MYQAKSARTGTELSVAVNLGQVNLIDRQLPGDVAAALERWDVPAERLHLEITENLVMADPRRTMEVLGALRALGVGLSLDDFGTGQTSLACLRKLSLDEIKIDRSFVLELGRDEDAAAIVRSTVQMAQALRLRVVAEGAEDAAAMRRARSPRRQPKRIVRRIRMPCVTLPPSTSEEPLKRYCSR